MCALAAHAMGKIERLYGSVFEGILGERITNPAGGSGQSVSLGLAPGPPCPNSTNPRLAFESSSRVTRTLQTRCIIPFPTACAAVAGFFDKSIHPATFWRFPPRRIYPTDPAKTGKSQGGAGFFLPETTVSCALGCQHWPRASWFTKESSKHKTSFFFMGQLLCVLQPYVRNGQLSKNAPAISRRCGGFQSLRLLLKWWILTVGRLSRAVPIQEAAMNPEQVIQEARTGSDTALGPLLSWNCTETTFVCWPASKLAASCKGS